MEPVRKSQIFKQVKAQVHEDVVIVIGKMKMKEIAKEESNISYDFESNVFCGTMESINITESRISKLMKQFDDERISESSNGQCTSQASSLGQESALIVKQQSCADSECAMDIDHLPNHATSTPPASPTSRVSILETGADNLFTQQQQCGGPENQATVGTHLSSGVSNENADPNDCSNISLDFTDQNNGQTQQMDGAEAQSKCSSRDTQNDLHGGNDKASPLSRSSQPDSHIATNQLTTQILVHQQNAYTASKGEILGQCTQGQASMLTPNTNDAQGSSQGYLGKEEGASPPEIQRSASRIYIELHIWRYICFLGIEPQNVEIDDSSLSSGYILITENSKVVQQTSRTIDDCKRRIEETVDFQFIELKTILNKLEEIRTILLQMKHMFPDAYFWLEEKSADPQVVVANNKKSPTTKAFDAITAELHKIISSRRKRVLKNDTVEKTFVLPSGPQIHCFPGNITRMNVDAIISSADCTLSNKGGVSKAIASAAGTAFQEECRMYIQKIKRGSLKPGSVVVTGAHQLPCQKVIHIVISSDSSKEELMDVFIEALSQANTLRLTSLAIPSVGAKTMRLKNEDITESIVRTLLHFCKQKSCLTDILLVDVNEEMPRLFGQQLAKNSLAHNLDLLEKPAFSSFLARHESKPHLLTRQMSGQRGEAVGRAEETKWRHQNVGQLASKPHDYAGICCICMDTITNIHTLPCKHTFCRDCIGPWLKQKPSCPNCGEIFGPMKGNQPDGTMKHYKYQSKLPGHEQDSLGTIEIIYNFPSGKQTEDHPNPGVRYTGDRRTAYLPDNHEGRDILRLFEIAFKSKILFTIGRSVTTGREGRITWNDVHHKTKQTGGASKFGYPDDTYLKRVREELAAKGIK